MTLIIGIKCTDGIVVGADGAATLGSLGQMTVRQPVRKLECLDSLILGVSGPVGLGQLFSFSVKQLWENKKLSNKQPFEAMAIIRDALAKQLVPEFHAAAEARKALGDQLPLQSVLSSTIVALPVAKVPCLFQFNHQAAPEAATDSLPFVAIGSGQSLADPFLAFLRRIFWPAQSPTLADGVLATYWTLQHAIQSTPGGVAEPMQIMVLEKVHNDWCARELGNAELSEHSQAVSAAEEALRNFRVSLQNSSHLGPGDVPPSPERLS
jgi:hypothetical protein